MTLFDYAVLGIIGLSLLIGLMRGAVKEVLSLGGWIAAFWIANTFADDLGKVMSKTITNPTSRMVVAYVLLFVATLLVVALLQIVLSELVKAVGLGGFDRMLGVFVGFARGVLIVVIAVLVCGMTLLPEEPFWRNAISSKWFETVAVAVKAWLPSEITKRIHFR